MPCLASIVIPVYNAEKYLAECLDSIIGQTLADIEIICVNDGSSDSSLDILRQYAEKDERILVLDRQNKGVSAARNAALPLAGGRYAWFIDADDMIERDACRLLFEKAEESGADMVLLFYRGEDNEKRPAWRKISASDKISLDDKRVLFNYPAAWNAFRRADFLRKYQILFPEGISSAEDHFLHWQSVVLAKKIAVVPERLYYYRRHTQSVSVSGCEKWMDIIPAYDAIRRFLLESGHYAEYRDEFLSRKLRLWRNTWKALPDGLRPEFAAKIRSALTDDDRAFIVRPGSPGIKYSTKWFYRATLRL
jgi:glycosyltransferase involved in cell wall biosynthesis